MIKYFKVLVVVICFFILQSVFEIILMSLFAKMGITYMDVEVRGESFREVIEAISVYYFYSKLLYIMPAYFFLTIALILCFFRAKELVLKNIAVVHITVNLFVFLVIWFSFGNDLTFITNPLLGLLLAGLLIYFLASKIRKPLIEQRIITII